MNGTFHIYLASASPRRRELLDQIGIDHTVKAADLDESIRAGETAPDYVTRLAIAKAMTGWNLIKHEEKPQTMLESSLVIGADTCIALDQHLLGKPEDNQQARDMLSKLSGNCHHVFSAVAVLGKNEYNLLRRNSTLSPELLASCLRVNDTLVEFKPLSSTEIEGYVVTGESIGKAGAYAIQGKAACFIRRIEGSYSSVMGLPLFETSELLRQHGIESVDDR
jgi:septum formation protein